MNCVILYRVNGGPAQAIRHCDEKGHDTGELVEFDNIDEAVSFVHAPDHPFARLIDAGQVDYQIVELDEL